MVADHRSQEGYSIISMDTKCSICRREGTKLFLKGDRCFSAKCAMVKKAYAPGIHGRGGKRRSMITEYGKQLRAKQELKRMYGLREKQFKNYFKDASKKRDETTNLLVEYLELRLDNIIYRLGWAKSRKMARQLISHGHILVNNKSVNIPSYRTKINDKFTIKQSKLKLKLYSELKSQLRDFEPPKWLKLDKNQLAGEISDKPDSSEVKNIVNLPLIVEFYSR